MRGVRAEGGVYLPACSVLLFWSLCVIIDSKRNGRIYIRAKEVMGGRANTFLARVSELRIGIYIRACVAKINIKSKRKMRNGKWEIHSPVICPKKKENININIPKHKKKKLIKPSNTTSPPPTIQNLHKTKPSTPPTPSSKTSPHPPHPSPKQSYTSPSQPTTQTPPHQSPQAAPPS